MNKNIKRQSAWIGKAVAAKYVSNDQYRNISPPRDIEEMQRDINKRKTHELYARKSRIQKSLKVFQNVVNKDKQPTDALQSARDSDQILAKSSSSTLLPKPVLNLHDKKPAKNNHEISLRIYQNN